MAALEESARSHANRVLAIVDNQRKALSIVVAKAGKSAEDAEVQAEAAMARLAEASQRHQDDAKSLRVQLGELKSMIDAQSQHVQDERRRCEELLGELVEVCSRCEERLAEQMQERRRCEELLASTKELLSATDFDFAHSQRQHFEAQQPKLMAKALLSRESLPGIIHEAQAVARSRSPSLSRVGASSHSGASSRSSSVASCTRGRSLERKQGPLASHQRAAGGSFPQQPAVPWAPGSSQVFAISSDASQPPPPPTFVTPWGQMFAMAEMGIAPAQQQPQADQAATAAEGAAAAAVAGGTSPSLRESFAPVRLLTDMD